MIGYDCIYGRRSDDERKMFSRHIGWAKDHPSRNAIEFKKSQRRGELVVRGDEHGAAA
jgi:hypothetical protein